MSKAKPPFTEEIKAMLGGQFARHADLLEVALKEYRALANEARRRERVKLGQAALEKHALRRQITAMRYHDHGDSIARVILDGRTKFREATIRSYPASITPIDPPRIPRARRA